MDVLVFEKKLRKPNLIKNLVSEWDPQRRPSASKANALTTTPTSLRNFSQLNSWKVSHKVTAGENKLEKDSWEWPKAQKVKLFLERIPILMPKKIKGSLWALKIYFDI